MLRAKPSNISPATSQVVRGESFALLDLAGGWAWGYCQHDSYVGYLPEIALAPAAASSHVVTAPLALVFAGPDIKAPILQQWPIGAQFAGTGDGSFIATDAGFVHARHASPLSATAVDPVMVAERLVGLPYLWGGRGAGGIDCSGLVQVALGLAGDVRVPRDSDLQRAALGEPLSDEAPLARGDLIFFPGHVGLMVDGTRLIHANAYWMAVTIEPLAEVVARLAADHARPILARRRMGAGT